ncbi:hypothetical protein E0H73_39750 [Kribbella pittospori]|uniref:UspA domain-containing protein n=1 Tax=Kribbella pittospori TaxID=722689 RepID=A0A4R0KFH7_9ACTN|nr:hypothetical protein E0H73_39750 [Kribbella pittospori]
MTVRPVVHVGVDGSWRDTGALEWALQESLLRREPLHVVHVIDERVRHAPADGSRVGPARDLQLGRHERRGRSAQVCSERGREK